VQKIAIIGGGSASFITADLLSNHFEVTIYEKGTTLGRKYLVAGKGGFNLSHQMDSDTLLKKYNPASIFEKPLSHFGLGQLRKWYSDISVPTYIGSSNRIFPKVGISPGDVLRKIKHKLTNQGVKIQLATEFIGFSEQNKPLISSHNQITVLESDIYIFALGGGSWKVTGANSKWLSAFEQIGINTLSFEASNCGLNVNWSKSIKEFHLGKPLKNITISHGSTNVKGEALITQYGLEGNAIYPISSVVRKTLKLGSSGVISLDLKPEFTAKEILQKIKNTKPSNYSKILKLDASKMAIVKSYLTKEEFLDPELFAQKLKQTEVPIESLRAIEEAISTVGGIHNSELNEDFSLIKFPNIYCIGEMVDWDAPTGGFLLQGCFSMGAWTANQIIKHKKPD
jgi:uncharacterized flavoprotein (TIGR03862 family)